MDQDASGGCPQAAGRNRVRKARTNSATWLTLPYSSPYSHNSESGLSMLHWNPGHSEKLNRALNPDEITFAGEMCLLD